MKLKNLPFTVCQVTSPYVCVSSETLPQSCERGFLIKIMKSEDLPLCCIAIAGCEWPGRGEVLVTANGRNPESRTILQRMSSPWKGKHLLMNIYVYKSSKI